MRTKLFLAFFAVILTALVSNFIFEHLIIKDFEDYVMGAREDRLYWVLASVEGSYDPRSGWDRKTLEDYLHWATMLGFDVQVLDAGGKGVLTSREALKGLTPTMRRRMEALVNLNQPMGEFESYPLFAQGKEIGSLHIRPLERRGLLKAKEGIFKRRGRTFLVTSFVIAGGGAVFLSAVFSIFLTGPIKRLTRAAGKVSTGDLSVRVPGGSKDEIGRFTQAFNHMVESLEREEALRKHLTSNVAHELRTPLTVMKAHLEGVADGVVRCDRETVAGLAGQVERLISLVEGIEDFAKAEASFFKPAEYETVELGSLARGVVASLSPMLAGKPVEVSVLPEGECAVTADLEKLEIILRNIITNAIKYTDRGAVRVELGKTDGSFHIQVRDTGRGIAPEDLPHIFKRFYKGKGSSGMGLGLAIVKELVGIMGGRLDATSDPGKGSTFRISLPQGKK
ncbi:MAG: HAMP domain-containing sensor histidine kinase [Nitrospirota bacterium]|jgi:two-component system sensor histidine kinase BaeS